jgi:hypothetical protein
MIQAPMFGSLNQCSSPMTSDKLSTGPRKIDEDGIRQRWESIGSKLDERGRRLWAAGEVQAAGHGALQVVSRITGIARSTINRGEDDLDEGPLPDGRVRRKGGGKPLSARDPTLVDDLKRLVEPATLGSPVQPLRWVSKSREKLARALSEMGHKISGRICFAGKGLGVVGPRCYADTARFHCIVHRIDCDRARCIAWDRLICEEVVSQAVNDRARQLRDVCDLAVRRIAEQYSEDLVVGFTSLDHAKTADWPRLEQDLATRDGSVCQEADVERVAIPVRDGRAAHERIGRDLIATIRARDKSVQRRTEAREALRAIHHEVTGVLVDLVLHPVGRDNLDAGADDLGEALPRIDAVPGVGTIRQWSIMHAVEPIANRLLRRLHRE